MSLSLTVEKFFIHKHVRLRKFKLTWLLGTSLT